MSLTIAQLIKTSETTLREKHPDTAAFESKQLIRHYFGFSSGDLILNLHNPVTDKVQLNKLKQAISERLKDKPLDLILGNALFRGTYYEVDEQVLLPRAETELLVDYSIEAIQSLKTSVTTIVELGFGSGIISIELAKQFPDSSIHAWDISDRATQLAKKNIEAQGIQNIHLYNDCFFNAEAKWQNFKDFIFVSNPPYIPSQDIQGLDTSVLQYDPITALDGGTEGLDFYKRCLKTLQNKAILHCYEIGINQHEALKTCSEALGYDSQFFADYHDIPRVMIARPTH